MVNHSLQHCFLGNWKAIEESRRDQLICLLLLGSCMHEDICESRSLSKPKSSNKYPTLVERWSTELKIQSETSIIKVFQLRKKDWIDEKKKQTEISFQTSFFVSCPLSMSSILFFLCQVQAEFPNIDSKPEMHQSCSAESFLKIALVGGSA